MLLRCLCLSRPVSYTHLDEAVACGAFRLRDIDVRLLDRDDIAAEAVFQDADGLAAHVEGEVNGSGKDVYKRQVLLSLAN